jgi:hypothetical protein
VQWIEEGEKPTKYFCGLESKNFTSKIIPKIERDDGKTITKQFDILKETKVFYEELYKFREGNGCKVSCFLFSKSCMEAWFTLHSKVSISFNKSLSILSLSFLL